jgi:uncharacterized protein with PIN domain
MAKKIYKVIEVAGLKDIAPTTQTTCEVCNKKIEKGQKRINLPHGSYQGSRITERKVVEESK